MIRILINYWRHMLVLLGLAILLSMVAVRVIMLQVVDGDFLLRQGVARMERVEQIEASRGMLMDRNGEPMAVSVPMVSIWADPREVRAEDLPAIARFFGLKKTRLQEKLSSSRAFVYLQRHMVPDQAEKLLANDYLGVYGQTEYKRYYPAGEAAAQIIGLTNIDDQGQEGLELTFNTQLTGIDGQKRVLKDLYGRTVRDVESIAPVSSGQDLALTIDLDLQYLAYRELKSAVAKHQAKSGALVLLDVQTGGVLAMVNQPSFNPNNRSELTYAQARNRSVTDVFEPGSVVKTFTMAAALESGQFQPETQIHTAPGFKKYNGHTIRDAINYGDLQLSQVLVKSSNIGASSIAIDVGAETVWQTFFNLGLGQPIGLGLPGESAGSLPNRPHWKDIELATFSYGYGLTVTPLQLAQAYAAIANDGIRVVPSILKDNASPQTERVLSERTAGQLSDMLESVVAAGTGRAAASSLYRIGGKTGTAHKVGSEGYSDDRYLATFAGFAPVSSPRLAMVLMIDEPNGDKYYGGEVAAPAFGRIMQAALQHMDIAPDKSTAEDMKFALNVLEVSE